MNEMVNEQHKAFDFVRLQNDSASKVIGQQEIKGYREDQQNRIICLDCGKIFKHKSTYSEHRKL